MEIEVKGDSELNKVLNNSKMQQIVTAKNAQVTINGIKIEHNSNEIKDAPEGITFTLVKTAEKDKADQSISETVTVAHDIEPTKKAIKNWVDAYNNLHSFYKTQTKYEPTKLGEAPSANNGVLLNDSSSAMIFSQVKI
ncbi:MAG: flagellar filament capping protein FliD [Candidatus Arsenophonus phytopathogenicus]